MQVKIQCLSIQEANQYLFSIGMGIGEWNQIVTTNDGKKSNWINYHAPENSHELENFAFHVAGWLPEGKWKMLQIDNSSYFDVAQLCMLNRVFFGSEEPKNYIENRSFLIEFGKNNDSNCNAELLLANLIYLFLQYECHGQIVSSSCNSEQILSIQDGFVYFIGDESGLSSAKSLLKVFENSPLSSPDWVNKITVETESRGG